MNRIDRLNFLAQQIATYCPLSTSEGGPQCGGLRFAVIAPDEHSEPTLGLVWDVTETEKLLFPTDHPLPLELPIGQVASVIDACLGLSKKGGPWEYDSFKDAERRLDRKYGRLFVNPAGGNVKRALNFTLGLRFPNREPFVLETRISLAVAEDFRRLWATAASLVRLHNAHHDPDQSRVREMATIVRGTTYGSPLADAVLGLIHLDSLEDKHPSRIALAVIAALAKAPDKAGPELWRRLQDFLELTDEDRGTRPREERRRDDRGSRERRDDGRRGNQPSASGNQGSGRSEQRPPRDAAGQNGGATIGDAVKAKALAGGNGGQSGESGTKVPEPDGKTARRRRLEKAAAKKSDSDKEKLEAEPQPDAEAATEPKMDTLEPTGSEANVDDSANDGYQAGVATCDQDDDGVDDLEELRRTHLEGAGDIEAAIGPTENGPTIH